MKNIYKEMGYQSRKDYLKSLSNGYNVPMDFVVKTAKMYGKQEDFKCLVYACEDYDRKKMVFNQNEITYR